jgi:aspartyl-tRNA(Asn)/glutamyl-tRNA(Gln) amidotransferase subunit B
MGVERVKKFKVNPNREIILAHPQAVSDYRAGKTASMQFLVGKAMGVLRGRGNPNTLRELFDREMG